MCLNPGDALTFCMSLICAPYIFLKAINLGELLFNLTAYLTCVFLFNHTL